jgi:hypothetical protein
VAAEAEAERLFRDAVGPPAGWTKPSIQPQVRDAARAYVSALVFAYSHEMCAAVRAGRLSAENVGWLVESFEEAASRHAHAHLELAQLVAYPRYMSTIQEPVWSHWSQFHAEVIPAIHQSPGWHDHLQERRDCASANAAPPLDNEAQAKGHRRAQAIEPLLKKKGWTRSGWAAKAGVKPDVVYDYFAGADTRPDKRNELATVLALPELPD